MPPQESRSAQQPAKQIGYFCHLKLEEKHLGAILVTNQIGVPLEFKYTEPVTTTRLHKILYGSVLDRYLHETVIRDRLVREVRSEPDYFITPYDEKEYLSALGKTEMIAVQRYSAGQTETSGPFTRIREREAIVDMEDGPSLRVAFSTTDEAIQHRIITWLQEIGRTMDILEPIERINVALKTLCGEEKKL
jgi:hypothetical protein